MHKKIWATLLTLALAVGPAAAYDCNIDIKNTSTKTAWDVAVVLEGIENVGPIYPGYFSGRFQTITTDSTGPNTVIHWENPTGSVAGDGISQNEVVHVGWSTGDQNSHVVDMYWTGKDGQRLFGSTIVVTLADIIGNRVTFSHAFASAGIDLRHIRYSVRSTSWPLAELNPHNLSLMSSLRPLADLLHLEPGDVVSLSIPESVPPGASVTVVYEAESGESDALATVFVQDSAE